MSRSRPGRLTNPETPGPIIQAIIDAYMRGCTVQSLADEYEVSRQAIYYHLRKRGIVERRRAYRSSNIAS